MPFAPHEIENKRFVVALRGYQTDEVDGFLRAVAADYRVALEQAEDKTAAEINELLARATDEAAGIREGAHAEARQIRAAAHAQANVAELRLAAQAQARAVRKAAEKEAEQIRREAAEIRDAALKEAEAAYAQIARRAEELRRLEAALWSRMHARIPEAMRVRVLSPKPSAVYRWYTGRGTVTDHERRTLEIESACMLAELLPPGTAFAAGDILGRLRGAQPVEALLARHRARLAFYQQMRDSMRAANNLPELRQAEIKLADKQRLIDEANASLAKLIVRASEPGEVVETLAMVGMPVKAHAPLVKVKGRVLHGEFEIDAREAGEKPAFCRVEVIGLGPHASNEPTPPTAADVGSPDAQAVPRFVDCSFISAGSDAGAAKIRVALPDNLGLVPGQPLRLARHRFDAVFPVPAAAVAGADDHRSVWIASPTGAAERRDVTVADVGDDVLVSGGLRVGEEVIVDAPAALRDGAAIVVER